MIVKRPQNKQVHSLIKFAKWKNALVRLFFITPVCFLFLYSCDQKVPAQSAAEKDSLTYLNHSDSARYVGMNTCKLCHQDIYNSFIRTGMGRSFDLASRTKSAGDFSKATLYDKYTGMHYRAYWQGDSLCMQEYRLEGRDTSHSRTGRVSFIIGSGQHTNSHLQSVNGYVTQMPMTFYTQKRRWDLPPGFENGLNTRFARKIGLECINCHNAYPQFEMGSENKFRAMPLGIDCERCHGPGSIHVAQRQTGSRVDTSKLVDRSIVNPAKLPIEAQFDICQRCHLQGNAVLKEGRSFFDFKPGQKLSDYISVFLPKYKNADDEFIMASHADRLKQSACFIKSFEKSGKKNALKPYQGAMTCITCHNPHVSVKETNKNVFNDACLSCHNITAGVASNLETIHKRIKKWDNCVTCHMPLSGSSDIPHVTVHDHYIRKPVTKTDKEKIKTFLGLYSINEKDPDKLTRARAWINQYEKFGGERSYLDSALKLMGNKPDENNMGALVQLHFIKQDFASIIKLVKATGEKQCLERFFIHKSYDNSHAWSAYRVGEAFYFSGNIAASLQWFRKASELAPFQLDFRSKLGTALAGVGKLEEAVNEFEFVLSEDPRMVQPYSNLGYIKLLQGYPAEALRLYNIGKKLDPDNEGLLLNLAGYYAFMKDMEMAKKVLERILLKNPSNLKAKKALEQMQRQHG